MNTYIYIVKRFLGVAINREYWNFKGTRSINNSYLCKSLKMVSALFCKCVPLRELFDCLHGDCFEVAVPKSPSTCTALSAYL